MSRRRPLVRTFTAAVVLLAIIGDVPAVAQPLAMVTSPQFLERLTPDQRRAFDQWHQGRTAYDAELDAYWQAIDTRKAERKRKRAAAEAVTARDYVATHPPKYMGPPLRPDIAEVLATVQASAPETALPLVTDYLAMARQHFSFAPLLTTEQEFKRRYAYEALRVGLSKDQVLRVYALETGGRGTYDMQSGFDPETKKGRAISSAIGYAQLLHGNSVNELVTHGDHFVARLNAMSVTSGVPPQRAQQLIAKAQTVRAMIRVAKSVPNEWSEHVKLGGSPRGMGIHALNLDADVGPWMQVLKLNGLRTLAEKSGRPRLAGAEIELMNLAGPKTGLEMMEPAALGASTANFFSQQGFYRNTIVREKSSAELLKALEQRMDVNIVKTGAVEFAQIFDELAASGVGPIAVAAAGVGNVPAPVPARRPKREEATDTGRLMGFAVFDSGR